MSQDDQFRYEAIIKCFLHFGWNWVVLVTRGDVNGDVELEELSRMMKHQEICIEHVISLKKKRIDKALAIFKNSTANIVILCGHFSTRYLEFLRKLRIVKKNITLIVHESWTQLKYASSELWPAFNCSLMFTRIPKVPPGLMSYITGVSLYTNPDDPPKLHGYVKKGHYIGPTGEIFQFNERAEVPSRVLLVKWVFKKNEEYDMVLSHPVAMLSGSRNGDTDNSENNINWYSLNLMPESRCNDRCPPGYRRVPSESFHVCCYSCLPCPKGEVSNVTDSKSCFRCPDEEWPNEKKVKCVSKLYEFLSYENDWMVLCFSLATSIFSAITLFVLKNLIYHWDTPIVKANNRTVSFILLTSILLSFLCAFLFFERPVNITCKLRQISYAIIFTIFVSSVLAKTTILFIEFKATKISSSLKKRGTDKVSNALVLTCSSVQVLICVIWMSVSPPYQEYDMDSYPGKIIIQCNEGSVMGFYSMLGYMGFLAAVSFVLAFMVRTLPDSFNEAKYITFSMLVFCSVWIAMIPAYLSTRGKYMVAVEVFAILASSVGILGCIFFPKCYIIIYRPELNTRKKHAS
ncbi:vomeronasal type-2 receptor 26-like [Pyxicephalus adspersus]|uniref:vomeronasal type-2 receptor 26-like n=1 Tax=Pyxicephalus adspersus TaxID=30357 RepID=UPI003B58BEB9